ncbi:hypothetical protein F5887DRAFT_1076297 [Amanita rubescens]|nr:hypothetical protein F5887DRAFT_1076297 [Amanita rubescens]
MNTIIFHPFNRVKSTPTHDLSAALIAPVSKWYRKPTPWWVDGFEEVGLQPIVETDEIAEEEEEDVIEEQEELGAVDDDALEPAGEDVTFENVQGDEEGKQNSLDETNVFQVAALQNMVFDDDLPGIDQDQRDDETAFLDDLMRADEVSFHESDGDDTLINATFIDKDVTVILEAELVDEYEWDENEMLNIVIIEVDPENDNTCSSLNANQIIPTESPRNTQGVGVWPGKLGSETRWVTTRTACQWLAGSLDGSGYDPGKAYLQLPDDLAVKAADVVGYPLATAVVEHDIGCGSARAFSVGDATDHTSNSMAPQLADEVSKRLSFTFIISAPFFLSFMFLVRPSRNNYILFHASWLSGNTSIARGSSGFSLGAYFWRLTALALFL